MILIDDPWWSDCIVDLCKAVIHVLDSTDPQCIVVTCSKTAIPAS